MLPIPWHSFDGDKAERFVSIMLLREFPDGSRRRATQGDGGIDVIVPVSDNPAVYDVYQIKKYYEPLKSDQKSKVAASARELLKTVERSEIMVRKWHLTLPVDGSEANELWLTGLFGESGITPRWKGLSYLEGLCAKYRDVVDYYVLGGQERLHDLVKLAMRMQPPPDAGEAAEASSIEATYQAVLPAFEKLNSDDPHYYYNISMLHGDVDFHSAPPTAVMSQFLGREGEATLRVDVFPRYAHALDDRPITTKVTVRVPSSEAAAIESVERFNLYGEDLIMPPEYATVEIDDPLSGKLEGEPMHVRIWTPESQCPVRLRYIISELSGERVAPLFFNVKRLSQGVSGKGFSATLESDAKLLIVTQSGAPSRTEADTAEDGNTTFNFRLDWGNRIAAQVMDDIRFGRAIRASRKLVLAQEFTGPFLDILEFPDSIESPVPEWLERYALALSELQEFADVPLRLVQPVNNDPMGIEHAIRVGSLLHGGVIGQRSPMIGVQLQAGSDLEEVVNYVNQFGRLRLDSTFESNVANGHIAIPDALYSFEGVTARIGLTSGVEQVQLLPAEPSSEVTLTIQLKRFTATQD
jgi:hypothetical protein